MIDILNNPQYCKIWLITASFLAILTFLLMLVIWLMIPKKQRLLSRLQLSFLPERAKTVLCQMNIKVRKSFRWMLFIDFGFMLGVFGLMMVIIHPIDSSNLPHSIGENCLFYTALCYLISDIFEGLFSLQLLKEKFSYSYLTGVFSLLKWLSILFLVYILAIVHL